ncbi:MAG: glycosyltransferase family 4 protein [Acidobacteriia bacterium]|nr:glycosyltransferase family 4 protein [Terriglobia bacterium]
MKICFLSQEYPPESHFGGIGTYTYNVAVEIARLGHTVHVVTSTRARPRTYDEHGVFVHRIRQRNLRPQELSRLFYSFQVAGKVAEIQCPFDIVQSSEFGAEGYVLSLRRRFHLVTRLATPFYLTEKLNGKSVSGSRLLFDMFERVQTLRSDGIVASTRAIARTVAEKWRIDLSKIQIIPNSVDVGRIRQLGAGKDVPEILKDREFVLYFGRLEERKGVHVLARAVPAVLGEFPEICAAFIGSDAGYQGGSMRAYIREQAGGYQERLLFFDNLPQENLFPIVRCAKLVVLPSLWEAFGFVCVEAMALGRPVIATAGSGFEEIIVDGVSGLLVEPGNVESLSSGIIKLLRDRAWREKIATKAEARASDFEVSRVLPGLINYYEQVRSKA